MERKVEELISVYELEPELKDIYVEGLTDKSLISYFFDEEDVDVSVYEISEIDFSEYVEQNPQIYRNHRNQILFLSSILTSKVETSSKVAMIVDLDFFQLDNDIDINCFHLFPTDYSCLEAYAFNVEHLDKFFKLFLQRLNINSSLILNEIEEPLKDLYVIRYISKKYNLQKLDLDRVFKVDKKAMSVSFDTSDYVHKLLNKNSLLSIKENFIEQFHKIKQQLNQDIRFNINGHDFVYLLYLYLKKATNIKFINEKTIERALFLGCENPKLKKYQLFTLLNEYMK